jgi:hypothetical protein
MANRVTATYDQNRLTYRQVQFIQENDNRTLDERIRSLPTIREEDLPEWREWAEANVLDNR